MRENVPVILTHKNAGKQGGSNFLKTCYKVESKPANLPSSLTMEIVKNRVRNDILRYSVDETNDTKSQRKWLIK